MLWRLSGARVVCGALFKAIRIRAAAFAEINVARLGQGLHPFIVVFMAEGIPLIGLN
ncbi:hypothetical protein D3C73_1569940 [compost metagenome]